MIDSMLAGYLECAAWADGPEGSRARFSKSAIATAQAECLDFVKACEPLFDASINRPGYSAEQFGHDFWLNRCGHGAGFWDRAELMVEGFSAIGVDRSGKPYACAGNLGHVLSELAYGGSSISKFSGQELYAARGWLYFCKWGGTNEQTYILGCHLAKPGRHSRR